MGADHILSYEFRMQEFIDFADQQSEGAAPFKKITSSEIKYLHMRTKALETWENIIYRKKEELLNKLKKVKEMVAIE